MQSVNVSGLDELDRAFELLLKEQPKMRRELHKRIAVALKAEVDTQITTSGFRDSGVKLKKWQEHKVGSGGGYAAVRAIPGTGSKGKGDYANSPGAITNYNESGHRIRPPSGRAKRKRKGRAKTLYVNGRHFYEAARMRTENLALAEVEKFADEIRDKLEGTL